MLEEIASLRTRLFETADLADALVDGVVVGVPGVVDAKSGRIDLATSVAGLEGGTFRTALSDRLDLPVTLENDVNLAALGEQWRCRTRRRRLRLPLGRHRHGSRAVLHGELHRGHNGAAGEVDAVGLAHDVDPCAGAISEYTARLLVERDEESTLRPPFDARDIFAAARAGDALAHDVVEEVARRIALHIVPVAAVTDVSLAVLGGGLGARTGISYFAPSASSSTAGSPIHPGSTFCSGEAAVLTGALAIASAPRSTTSSSWRPQRA